MTCNCSRRRGRPIIIVIVVLLTVLVGPLFTVKSDAAENGKEAPDFQLTDLGGTVHALSGLRGNVVVLNFWATWCPECLVEIDSLSAFAEKYGKRGVVVLSVSVDKNEAALREFLGGHPVRFPVMIDREGDVFVRKYTIRGLPATIIIDRQGIIAARMLGAQEFLSKDFTGKIDGLLGK